MMGFQEFAEAVFKDVEKKAGGRFIVQLCTAVKNNKTSMTGIAAVGKDSGGGPCVYLNECYREYKSGETEYCEIVEEVFQQLVRNQNILQRTDLDGLRKWDTVKRKIRVKLVNAEQNKEQLKTMPHRRFLDLAAVYYVMIMERDERGWTLLIDDRYMEVWGQDEETLYQTALENMRTDGEADFFSIETLIKRALGISLAESEDDTDMYILTNRSKRFGAAELLDRGTLRMIADKVGDGFIVLPSSIHESIVLRPRVPSEYGELADMVRAVNDADVSEEERLSYHVYAYSRREDMLKIVA